jgi:hypothetical protein
MSMILSIDLYTFSSSTGEQPSPAIGRESLEYANFLLREPMTISVVNASVFLCLTQAILHFACFRAFPFL